LGAHAIINVVVDHDDVLNETVERRHVEAGHQPTPSEQAKMKLGLITAIPDPAGGTIYVEHNKIINRTYTGTALAIKYKDSPIGTTTK
jgi:hypothetical protein